MLHLQRFCVQKNSMLQKIKLRLSILFIVITYQTIITPVSSANLSPIQAVINHPLYQAERSNTTTGPATPELQKVFRNAQLSPVIYSFQNAFLASGLQLGGAVLVRRIAGSEGASLSWYNAIVHSITQFYDSYTLLTRYQRYGDKEMLSRMESTVMANLFNYPDSVLTAIAECGETARSDPHAKNAALIKFQHLALLRLNSPLPKMQSQHELSFTKLFNNFYTLLTSLYDPDQNSGVGVLAFELSQFAIDVSKGTSSMHYISVSGPHGIGKTETTRKIYKALNQVFESGTIYLAETVMQDGSDIEGTPTTPSILLRVIGEAKTSMHARGIFMVLDEGTTHLNQHIDSAKRAFNSKTEITGGHFLGETVKFPTLPMILFILSNDAIQDLALASRMTQVSLISPNPKILEQHIEAVAQKLQIGLPVQLNTADLQMISQKITNFREVESKIKEALSKKLAELMNGMNALD
jgi:hypothetical protein